MIYYGTCLTTYLFYGNKKLRLDPDPAECFINWLPVVDPYWVPCGPGSGSDPDSIRSVDPYPDPKGQKGERKASSVPWTSFMET